MRIAVCRPQELFTRGGAEIFTDSLVAELRARGHDAEIVSIPFVTWPNDRLLTSGMQWRLIDLAGDTSTADLVIATKFPSYLIRHPNKVVWLIHQFRQAYELHGTQYGQLSDTPDDVEIRRNIQLADREALHEARRVFATSYNVAGRLRASTEIEAEVLPHPPQHLPYRCDRYDPFVLSVGRLDPMKRVDLLLEAATNVRDAKIVVVGDGPERERLEERYSAQLGSRVRFAGRVDEETLTELYATCRAVFYAPVDEDFGMVPYEAFQAMKPVLTTTDSGAPLDVVRDGVTGRVAKPEPNAIAVALRELIGDEAIARRYGNRGHDSTSGLDWDSAIERLLAAG